jgi:regulator of protease activity HflC (stomatin/prohibitin superfamily)
MIRLVGPNEGPNPDGLPRQPPSGGPFADEFLVECGRPSTDEIARPSLGGAFFALVGILVLLLGIVAAFGIADGATRGGILLRLGLVASGGYILAGLYVLHPNQAAILTLFGAYRGTDRSAGLRWSNPLCRVRKISLRTRSFISEPIKVNDSRGNPIEIAAAILWRVRDTARATFDVEDYAAYVHVQSEAAIRYLASSFAYDDVDETRNMPAEMTLRSGIAAVNRALSTALQTRFDHAGLVVEDAKLTHLAYAPEIASMMLRRQQAEAVIAARQKIVTGAVTMVEMALRALAEHAVVELDDERKASMVSNLMVVLCAETDVKPVVNVGTLYS